VEGRATEAVRRLLAGALGLTLADVVLVSGERSRVKRFRLSGLARDEAVEKVEMLVAQERSASGD
jgi:uncharacterized protein YggU (UPF0235/DUF167 family)